MFTTLIYQPLLNLAVFFYNTIGFGDLGVAIVLVTFAVRLVLAPLSIRAQRSQRAMAKLTPHLEALREKHKEDTQAQSEAVMKLYKEHGVNPLAGCLPLLIQLPILFGLYKVFRSIFTPGALDLVYHFIHRPDTISHITFGFLDISHPSHILALVAAAAQFMQLRIAFKSQPAVTGQAAALNQQMMYMLPVMIGVIGWTLPAGLSLYWVATTLFSLGEQLYLRRS